MQPLARGRNVHCLCSSVRHRLRMSTSPSSLAEAPTGRVRGAELQVCRCLRVSAPISRRES